MPAYSLPLRVYNVEKRLKGGSGFGGEPFIVSEGGSTVGRGIALAFATKGQ